MKIEQQNKTNSKANGKQNTFSTTLDKSAARSGAGRKLRKIVNKK